MRTYKNITCLVANNELRFAMGRNWKVEFNGLSFTATKEGKKMMVYNDSNNTLKVAKVLL